MKKLIIAALLTTCLLVPAIDANAQTSSMKQPQAEDILTAIDVADLISSGTGDSDIAKALSLQWGFDRQAALKKGNTDEQIIKYLITKGKSAKKSIDDKKAQQLNSQGDIFYKASQFEKAAKEYTRAINCSENKYGPYKFRADAYKQVLTAKWNPALQSNASEARQPLFDKSRTLLCYATYSDYATARKINDNFLAKASSEITVLKARLEEQRMKYQVNRKDTLSREIRARNVLDVRQLTYLSRLQEDVIQANITIDKAISDYKLICQTKEDMARLEAKKSEKDKIRDKKWVKYGEKEETSYFYDRSSIADSKNDRNVWTRHEDINDDKAYDAVLVRMNCKIKTVGTVEMLSYDEMGNSASEKRENVIMREVMKGAIEEELLQKACK